MQPDKSTMRLKRKARQETTQTASIRLFFILLSLSAGCSSTNINKQVGKGITFVAPIGSPPADVIAWSPVGNKLLVTAGDVGMGRAQVYTLDIFTGEKDVLVNTEYGDIVASTWSPDGQYVLIVARKDSIGSGAAGLWKLDVKSKSLEYLIDSAYAIWSPDSRTIATFSAGDSNIGSGKVALSLIDVKTNEVTRIFETSDMKYFFGLSWSPDGQDLVFGLGKDGPGNLYTVNTQTKEVTQITENAEDNDPAWSPSGSLIAYVSWPAHGSKTTLHLMDVINKCNVEIQNLEYVQSPAWSPDGKKMAYIASDGIYYLDLDKFFDKDVYQRLCQ
jgi:Tol biopolymer transport system component